MRPVTAVPPKVRAQVLSRASSVCERCGLGSGEFSVHHRRLRSQGGRDTLENLVLLCGSGSTKCHALVHSERRNLGILEGFIVPSWDDPVTVPITHWQHGQVYLTSAAGYASLPDAA